MFCFIDQMPPGMRETLYFKDDDSRLAFLQGNYITLTNMQQKDVERIIRLHLDPINISIQTTNPDLRCKMLNNRFAGEKLQYLDMLYNSHIEMNGQIVLCKGVNDKEELVRSIHDLSKYLPFMRSVSVVPAGITKYRDGLYPLDLFNKEESEEVIDLIESYQEKFYDEYGLHFIHASDEWYITSERKFPEVSRYDGYIQLENGVGKMRLMIDEFQDGIKQYQINPSIKKIVTLATGKLAYDTIYKFAIELMNIFPNLKINVYYIQNEFFGETITVSGLITGQDLIKQLVQKQKEGTNLGSILYIPSNMLRTGECVFLDDITIEDVENALDLKIIPIESDGKEFIKAIIEDDYRMNRNNENIGYIKAFDKEF